MDDYRLERDSLGEVRVPAKALYGPQTQRAVENFSISGQRLQRPFLRALGLIKSGAARVNGAAGHLEKAKAQRIEAAAEQVVRGEHDGEFVVDVFQSGSGTSTNMNANEVIARLAGGGGAGAVHPNDDVNRGQSSNDVIPTALRVAAAEEIERTLLPSLGRLRGSLEEKSRAFDKYVKPGRTHLQDAAPVRLGQEFRGYASQIGSVGRAIEAALRGMCDLPLGGTAVGTGLNAPPGFAAQVIETLAERTGLRLREARDHFEVQSASDAVVVLSGALRACAIALGKICNDVRLMGSGPRCGLGELALPAVQPGSSIMPGKVNPVILESALMACAQVIGHDTAIAWCAGGGTLELNAMLPLMAYDLLDSIALLAAVSRNVAERCIDGLEANASRLAELAKRSILPVTGLVPEIGYEKAAEIAKEALASGRAVGEVALERSGLSAERLAVLLDPERQVGSG